MLKFDALFADCGTDSLFFRCLLKIGFTSDSVQIKKIAVFTQLCDNLCIG